MQNKSKKIFKHRNNDYLFLNFMITKKIDCDNTTFHCLSNNDCIKFCGKSRLLSDWQCSIKLNVCEKTRNQENDRKKTKETLELSKLYVNIEKFKYFIHVPEKMCKLPYLFESIDKNIKIKNGVCNNGTLRINDLINIKDSISVINSCACDPKKFEKYTFQNNQPYAQPHCIQRDYLKFLYFDTRNEGI